MNDEIRYPEGITPERLMAYADGALDAGETARVEAMLAAHPELAEEVAEYRQTAAALAGAFDAPLDEAVPAHLEALIMGNAATGSNVTSLHAERKRRSFGSSPWGQAIAACAVFGFGALFGSQILADGAPGPTNGPLLVAGELEAAHPFARALETSVSAQTVEIPGGRFDAVATFPTATGATCREFEATDGRGAAVGLACRRGGAWTVEVLLHAETVTAPGGGFQLASGFDGEVIDAALDRLGAGVGLAAGAEACLIENDWDADACLSQ